MTRARRKLAWAASALAWLGACAPEPSALHWQLAFDSEALEQRAALLEARIAKGGCSSNDVVFASRFSGAQAAAEPPVLARGTYGFIARAQDADCRWYAQGCVELVLPAHASPAVLVQLGALPVPALDCDDPVACDANSCHAFDAGTPATGEPRDAGSTPPPPPVQVEIDAGDESSKEDARVRDEPDAGRVVSTVELEAEQADPLTAPLQKLDDANASGGAYISAPWDPASTLEQRQAMKRATPPADDDGSGLGTYSLEVPRAAAYRLWARVITPTLDEDSLWLRIDDDAWIQWNDIAHGDAWHWVDVRPFEQRTDRYSFTLAAGSHTLRISYRELGARLDRLLFTSDPDFVPLD
jgi:hypothetical protein